MAKISVVIPVYKVEEYLHKCIDSVLSQSFRDYELILVDDGSPDRCGEICDEYASRDKRITVIHKENGGLSDARNAALDLVSGEYITFIDSDDYVSQEHLQTLYDTLTSTNADLSVANITAVQGTDHDSLFYCPADEATVLEGRTVFQILNQPCAQAKLYRREVYEGIRFPVGKLYEDVFVFHEVLARCSRIAFTGKNTYFYLIRPGSIMHQEYRYEFTDIVDAVEARIKKLEELGLQEQADQNREYVYSRVAVAFANLDSAIPRNKSRLNELKMIYNQEYPRLMMTTESKKQKFRYWLLYRCPPIHSKLFGKKMSVSLG